MHYNDILEASGQMDLAGRIFCGRQFLSNVADFQTEGQAPALGDDKGLGMGWVCSAMGSGPSCGPHRPSYLAVDLGDTL